MHHPSPLSRPLLIAATLLTAVWAHAEEAAPSGEPLAAREHRFPISVADLEARANALFARLDGNGDGVIDSAEFEARDPGRGRHGRSRGFGPAGVPPMHVDRARGATDRAARRAEQEAELFRQLDGDADGALSQAEFAGLREARRTLRKKNAFARLDANGDGLLDRDEFPPRRLAGLDANGDGEISREEMRSARQSGKPKSAG